MLKCLRKHFSLICQNPQGKEEVFTMGDVLKALKAFSGKIDEAAEVDVSEFENDPKFMSECMADCLPIILQAQIMDESFANLDEATKDAFLKVQDYFVGQGLIDEATVPHINPKLNVVHMNKQAQINRLTSIITLKIARKQGSKNYTKYKMGMRIKKENMAEMKAHYGAKASILARKLYAKLQRNAKTASVVSEKKEQLAADANEKK